MHRRTVLLALAAAALDSTAQAAPTWTEGQHYFRVPSPQRTAVPEGKVEVTEVFSYGCPACDSFEPVMQRLKAGLPKNAEIAYLPASFNQAESWPLFQRAFYTAQAMGAVARTHEAMYAAIWETGELAVVDPQTRRLKRPQPRIEDAAKFYARTAGVKADQFIAAATSFGVEMNMQRADELIMAYQVDRTPSIVVNGKFRLHAQSAGGYAELIELVKYLVAQESKAS